MSEVTIKHWETIKENCEGEFLSKFRSMHTSDIVGIMAIQALLKMKEGSFKGTMALNKEIEDKCISQIRNCDIRSYKDLVAVCPKSFPSWIKNGKASIELLERGWGFVKI